TAAEQFLQQARSDFPNNSAGYRMLGDFYFAVGDVDKALAEYESLYRQHGSDPQVKKNYVQLLIMKGRDAEAGKLNDEMLKTNPNDPDALVYKGQILLRQGRATDAADTLQQVLHNDPNNAVAHYHLGVAFEQMGILGRAENEWREAVRLRPDLMDAYKTLAASDLRRNDWDSLARDADRIITLQAALPDGYALRAISEMNRNQGDKALADLRKAIEVAPQSPVGYIHMGNFYRRQNKYKDAENLYERALQRDPNAADALGGIVELNILQKQPEKAVARVQQQLKAQPTNSNYHYLLGALLFNNQDLKNAEAE